MLKTLYEDHLITVKEAAETLRTNEEYVLDLIRQGKLKASNINAKPNAQRPRWRILASDLGAFLVAQQFSPPKPPNKRNRSRFSRDYLAE
ncbi:MAG TPA: hypothetical protein DDW52_22765 [Planctomycetaceae bacterium]|nr:hypothetical protein [Planctomycetaceae bacterium]